MGEKYVVFEIGENCYSIPLAEVSQIIRYENVTAVPTAPAFVDGVINVGGEVIPVVNLRIRFSLPRREVSRRNRVIILRRQDIRYGILVDTVREILDLDPNSIISEAADVFGLKSEFVQGIVRGRETLLVLLDIFRVLATSPEVPIRE